MRRNENSGATTAVSYAAVVAKTGKDWARWFAVLDAAGANKMSHKQIVAYLRDNHDLGSWWQQMVAVAYERARDLRAKHEKPDGFEISCSRTLAASVERVFAAWQDDGVRGQWLLPGTSLVIRKATPNKSLRITWPESASKVDVAFYPKGVAKCQVAVQHGKLADAATAGRMKDYWAAAIGRLKALLERGG
jgi:uncharacterized protein YndB with AHSA1/START domain